MQGSGAAERDHRPGGDVLPPLDGVDPGRVRHVLVDHLGDGERGERVGEIEGRPDRAADRLDRPLRGKPDRSTRELRRIDAPEHDVGVRHRRPLAAPVVAGGAGVGPRARRADVEASHFVHPRDGPPAGPDLDHLDGRNAHREAASLEVPVGASHLEGAGRLRLVSVDEADLGRRPAHVEGDRVLVAALARDLGGEDRAAGRPGLDEPDREAGRVAEGGEPAAGGHEEERAPEAKRPELGLEAGEVARHPGLDIGVRAGRGLALVLPDLGAHLARKGDADLREGGGEDLPDPPLVGRVRVGVEQPDRDRLDAVPLETRHEGMHRPLVEGNQDLAPVVRPLGHRPAQVPRHEGSRPVDGDVVLLETVLEGHLDRVPEPLGDEERGLRAGALDEGVGGEGRAVDEEVDLARRDPRRADRLADRRRSPLPRERRGWSAPWR